MSCVAHVGSSLVVDGDGIEGGESSMDDEGDKRIEDTADVHDAFAQQQEHRHDCDCDVEDCGTGAGR